MDEPTRTPSTRNSVWSDSVPRMNSVVSLPAPPWLTRLMPARPRSRSGSERACAAFDLVAVDDFDGGERVIDGDRGARAGDDDAVEIGGGAASCASASEAEGTTAPARRRGQGGTQHVDGSPARTPARIGFARESRDGEEMRADARERRRGRRDALRIATSRLLRGRSPGLRVGSHGLPAAAPSRANAQWRMRWPARLPLRGQRRNGDRDAIRSPASRFNPPQERRRVTSKRRAV